MNNKLMPIIKWTGSKRSQAKEIVKYFPKFKVYYEPFLGGGSVLAQVKPEKAICGDICEPLIKLWQVIKNSPKELISYYKKEWDKLDQKGYREYYKIRERFNKIQNPFDLFFLSRTCVNGLIRFNKKGDFNNSLHYTRKGIHPERMKFIVEQWRPLLKSVIFKTGDYRKTVKSIASSDFIYLDPPYFYTKGRYYGAIDYVDFLGFLICLNKKRVKYALSFDGRCADRNYVVDIPKQLYKKHYFIESGHSSFRKVMGKNKIMVQESLYLNY